MRLATLRVGGTTAAVRVDGETAVETGLPDLGALLAEPDWRLLAENANGARHDVTDHAPLIPHPGKIICVGLNYRTHILEMGRELPRYPTLFAKFADALVGAHDEIVLPADSAAMDWEAELAVIVGATVRNADPGEAEAAIAGYSVLNDVTARDWQYRTPQWLQGKTWEASTPFGPVLVTPDELEADPEITCEIDGELVQRARVSDLVFPPAELVAYISRIVTLRPGDVIATGTPGGVGHARTPPRYLRDGSVLRTRISGIGELINMAHAS
ncbi:fumarylacetoacetate hydrolase family protein [Nonomuraea sp. B19D2]|uniref:fumarylacetoacetate hydrolase family protein n=1 Tax=Nonomuraea sp. B19D2 TaxID=3159561 RepID=UPI0032DA2866